MRRTKPAQRDYKITIAIDDSKSMDYNNSKELTLQAISLVSQALTLLESGRLSIMSFGEAPKIILNHSDQFDGPSLVSSLNFAQNQSRIAELMEFVRIANGEDTGASSDNGIFENLLLVLSDGRNIFSEGEKKVRNAIKLARLSRMFIVYIIIDNPENKVSCHSTIFPSCSLFINVRFLNFSFFIFATALNPRYSGAAFLSRQKVHHDEIIPGHIPIPVLCHCQGSYAVAISIKRCDAPVVRAGLK